VLCGGRGSRKKRRQLYRRYGRHEIAGVGSKLVMVDGYYASIAADASDAFFFLWMGKVCDDQLATSIRSDRELRAQQEKGRDRGD